MVGIMRMQKWAAAALLGISALGLAGCATGFPAQVSRFGGPYGGFYGRPFYSRFGYWGPRSPFYYGWGDPFSYGGFGGPYQQVRVYTVYQSFLDLDIRRKADNASLFEGHAKARSADDNMGVLVPNLIEAMFTGFPGHSGETVKITVPPAKKS